MEKFRIRTWNLVRWLLGLVVLVPALSSCNAGVGNDRPMAIEIAQEFDRLASRDLWPGFDLRAVPLAVFDGQQTFLFGHPSPPEEFSPLEGRPGTAEVVVRPGRFAGVTANSSASIGGVATATLLADGQEVSADALAAVAVHEAFHVFQRIGHPSWQGDEGALFVYPVADPDVLALRRLESRLLRLALDEVEESRAACRAHAAMAARRQRFARLDAGSVAYERGSELNEGLATYVQGRVAPPADHEIQGEGYAADEVRLRFYASGWALARLLDRFDPGWPVRMEAGTLASLDEALAAAVEDEIACSLQDDEIEAIRTSAATDAARVSAQRAETLAEFERLAGWRVIFEPSAGPLFPQGFDPLNVTTIDRQRVLHHRFLKLGSEAAEIEGVGLQALTEAAGDHPLFQGVRRVTFAGFDERPVTSTKSGAVMVSGRDFEATITGARFEWRETELIVRWP